MSKELTKEEVLEKLKGVKLKFSSYYKYSFSFRGENENYKISISYGGDHNDIYRYTVSADKEIPIEEAINFSFVQVTDKNTNEVVYEDNSWW